MTTKILALTDALGNLVRFILLPGQRFETVGVEPLIEGIDFGALLGDKAFDSNAIVAVLNKRGAKIVISQHPRRAQPLKIDEEMYKWRASTRAPKRTYCELRTNRVHCSIGRGSRPFLDPSLPPVCPASESPP